jgi:UDP-glucose 4-epimerase
MDILVVGGAGYIGSHVGKELFKKGHHPIIYDNLVYGHKDFAKWGDFVEADLSDKMALDNVFRRYSVEAVMHFSAYAYVGESINNPAKYYTNNVANTLNLLSTMLEYGVKYLIFSSSCAVYGNPQTIPIPEDHPIKPISPYGWSKVMVERIISDYESAYGLKYISLRYFNAAGADPDGEIGEDHDPETHLIPLALDAALGRKDFVRIFGTNYDTPDGTCIRDYIHVTDLANVHVIGLERLKQDSRSGIFNLGNGRGFSVREVIDAASSVTGIRIKAIRGERRPGDPPVLIASSKKAKKELGWKPKYPELETIIEHAWNWHKNRFENR